MLRLLGDIAARLVGDAIHTTTKTVTKTVTKIRGGVDVVRRARANADELAGMRERIAKLELSVLTLGIERDFMKEQLRAVAEGTEPMCLGAVLYRCTDEERCSCCRIAQRHLAPPRRRKVARSKGPN